MFFLLFCFSFSFCVFLLLFSFFLVIVALVVLVLVVGFGFSPSTGDSLKETETPWPRQTSSADPSFVPTVTRLAALLGGFGDKWLNLRVGPVVVFSGFSIALHGVEGF